MKRLVVDSWEVLRILSAAKTRISRPCASDTVSDTVSETVVASRRPPFAVDEQAAICESFRVLHVTADKVQVQYKADEAIAWKKLYTEEEDPRGTRFLEFWHRNTDWWRNRGFLWDDEAWTWEWPMTTPCPKNPWQKAVEMPASLSRGIVVIEDADTRFVNAYSSQEAIEEGVEIETDGLYANYGSRRNARSFADSRESFLSLWRSKRRYPKISEQPLCFTFKISLAS